MIEDIFLTYANNSLRDNPENFYEIFRSIKENIEIDLEGVDRIIKLICEFSKEDGLESFDKWYDYYSENSEQLPINFMNGIVTAQKAVSGDRARYYIAERGENDLKHLNELKKNIFTCEIREVHKSHLGEDLCEKAFNLKCYVCHQFKFINFIESIVLGKEFSEIEGINDILISSSEFSRKRTDRLFIKSTPKEEPFKEKLIGHSIFTSRFTDDVDINKYLLDISYFSLTEFFLNNDRRKLKRCPFCLKFFVAKDIKRMRCYSDDCRKAYERNKKRKQREDEPQIYC